MKNILFIILLFLIIGTSSCSKMSNQLNENKNSDLKSSGVAEYTKVNLTSTSGIVVKFTESNLFSSILSSISTTPLLDSSYMLSFDTQNIDVLHVPVIIDQNYSKSLLALYAPEYDTITEALILEKTIYNDSTVLKYYYPNGELAVSGTLNSSNHVVNFVSNNNPIYEPIGGMDCFVNCLQHQIEICYNDTACVILCMLLPEDCVAAWCLICVAECTYGYLNGGGNS